MISITKKRVALGTCWIAVVGFLGGAMSPQTGPETEKRFPPLKVPPGFKATLFACDPLIEYPSAIALGPRPGSIFVAVDFMTGLGMEIVRRDEIRLVEDTNGDGYADKATVYAKEFNSIEGMTFHDGVVYAMHAPFLTALRDTNGDGVADERRDIVAGLGLPPEKNPVRLHCANGVTMGHDGWLYLALGDHGCDVRRPEGDRLVLIGGGILRCRPDGRDLHVFASGLRNIYDVALDAELNVFVRDNENDGGDYKVRVCHSFFGADHGYPYLYYERPDEAMPPLADLGLGSSAGGVGYLEPQFPAEYRGNLFFCEWGRSVVRYRPERARGGFAPVKEIEFAAGAPNDPYGFHPTDLVVERDGSLIVADWADGQQPKRGRGRIYRIRHTPVAAGFMPAEIRTHKGCGYWITRLNSPSYHTRVEAQGAIERLGKEGFAVIGKTLREGRIGARGRLHAVWIMAHLGGSAAISNLVDLAKGDSDPQVQAQAIRALADLVDPMLARHRLDAGPGNSNIAERLAAVAAGKDTRVLLGTIVALGRLRWPGGPDWLRKNLAAPDAALAHAAMQTLRRSGNWPAVLKLLDEPSSAPIHGIALRAVSAQFDPAVVDGLIERLRSETDASRRREYADALTRVYKKPGPHEYWGYRPAPRPPNTVAWDRSDAIKIALDGVLADPDRDVRLAILQRMQREKIPAKSATLVRWLEDERKSDRVAALLESLRHQPAGEIRDALTALVQRKEHSGPNRLAALALLVQGLDGSSEARLLALADMLEDGLVLAQTLRQLGKRPKVASTSFLLQKLRSSEAEVRAASVESLAELGAAQAHEPIVATLADSESTVRRAAATAAGKLGVRQAAEPLLKLALDPDPDVRQAAFDSLRQLRELRALPLAVAAANDPQLQRQVVHYLADLGTPEHAPLLTNLAKQNPAGDILPHVIRALTAWSGKDNLPARQRLELERSVADIQAATGLLLRWQVVGPLDAKETSNLVEKIADPAAKSAAGPTMLVATSTEIPVKLPAKETSQKAAWLVHTDLLVPQQTPIEFLAASAGPFQIWLNGKSVHQREQSAKNPLDEARFTGTLSNGMNRVLMRVGSNKGDAEFRLRFRRKSATDVHEKLMQAALRREGNVERGRLIFFDAERAQCIKCHRLGDQGERIGPELTGVGSRFSRIHLAESILEPSRAMAPGFQPIVVALNDGRTLTGVKVAESGETLTIGDNQGQKHVLNKSDIEAQRTDALSIMPEGVEKKLTADEFVDLIAFLVSQKESR